jgi:hypothetical protein
MPVLLKHDNIVKIMHINAAICRRCKHLHTDKAGLFCDAFPNGIPIEIVENKVSPRYPYEGEQGIRFERRIKEKMRVLFIEWAIFGGTIPYRPSPKGKKWWKRFRISIVVGFVFAIFTTAFGVLMGGFQPERWQH